jgi:outer membrane protein OmpA-like peptidoglycan-associated protein
VVFPIESTTYRIIAEGPAGREEKTDFVEVVEPPAPTLLPEVLGRIHFDFDLWEIRADGVDTLAAVADFMRRHPDVRVLIEGHTDAKASEEYNIPLSNRRAEAARDYLVERHGIPASRLVTVGLGKSRFIAPNERDGKDYPEGRALNRRVEFRVLKTATP